MCYDLRSVLRLHTLRNNHGQKNNRTSEPSITVGRSVGHTIGLRRHCLLTPGGAGERAGVGEHTFLTVSSNKHKYARRVMVRAQNVCAVFAFVVHRNHRCHHSESL